MNKLNKIGQAIDSLYKQIFERANLILIFGVIAITVLKPTVELWWTKLLVIPLLSKFDNSIKSDCFFIVIVILALLYFIPKFFYRSIISGRHLIYLLLFTFLYLYYYRLNPKQNFYWFHFHISYINFIWYSDIIICYTVLTLLLYTKYPICSSILRFWRKEFSTPINYLYHDEPIKSISEDVLNRSDLAESIATSIINSNAPKSVAFGIIGEWGIGKTSLMNLVKTMLDGKKFIIVDFTPWMSFSKNEVINDFFKALALCTEKYSSELPNLLVQYASNITPSKPDTTTKFLMDLLRENLRADYNTQAKEINGLLKKINKKVVIFIDDLDRVESDIVKDVLQLIRSSADFENLIFLVAYDKSYVTHAIEKINPQNSNIYLEKIFLTEYTLPAINIEYLKNYLCIELVKAFPKKENEIKAAFDGSFAKPSVFNRLIIKNMRDSRRFLNYFISTYAQKAIQDEVVFDDFFRMELLRFRYPLVYVLMEYKGLHFLEAAKVTYQRQKPKYTLKMDGAKKESFEIEIELKNNFNNYLLLESEVSVAVELLKSVFIGTRYQNKENGLSIVYPENYHKYFIKRLLPQDFSEAQFRTYYIGAEDQLIKKISQWLNEGKRSLLQDKFMDIDVNKIQSLEEYKKHIDCIFYIGHFNEKSKKSYGGYDGNDLRLKLNWDSDKIKDWFNNKELDFKQFVMKHFLSAPSPYSFETEFLFQVDEHEIEPNFILNKEERSEIRIGYLQNYLEENEKLSTHSFYLLSFCDNIEWVPNGSNAYTKHIRKNPMALKVFREAGIEKDLDGFLIGVIWRSNKNKKWINNIVEGLFGSYDEFILFLDKYEESEHPFIKDIKCIYEEMKKQGVNNYVDYQFKFMPDHSKD